MTAFLHNPAPLHPLRLHQQDAAFPEDWAAYALEEAARNQELFAPAGTISGLGSDRAGQVLVELFFPDLALAMQGAIAERAPALFAALGLPELEVVEVEVQLTRYGDGEHYGRHFDCDDRSLQDRAVAWLWYLHTQPRAFEGGALRLYPTALRGGRPRQAPGAFVEAEPRHNTLACFDTRQLHEVRPVRGAPRWLDGRFSVNGWIRVR